MVLQGQLDSIAEDGGRIVNVIWQPKRTITLASRSDDVSSGYLIISEDEFPEQGQ
jgi:hypothetical protein